MIDVVKARKLIELTSTGWKLLNDEELLQIVAIFSKAADRAEKELDK